jgi:tRNA G18 (ribose-2'-O)-methylase SpoU
VTAPFADPFQGTKLDIGDIVIVVQRESTEVEMNTVKAKKGPLSKAPLFVVSSDRQFFAWFNFWMYLMSFDEYLEYV